MAVTEETPIASSVANGVTTVFPHTFTLLADADLVVTGTVDGVTSTYVLGVDYTVSGVGTSSGSVTFGAAPASGVIVTRYRDIALERATDYQDNGDLLADAVNLDFDRLWFALQDIFNGGKVVPTCVRAPNGETLIALPAAASRAGYFLGFDGSGQPTLLAATAGTAAALSADLATGSDALKGDALVGVRHPSTGGSARTQHQKNQDWLTIQDFGGVGDGTTDDTTAITNAISAAVATKKKLMVAGLFRHTAQITVPAKANLVGTGWTSDAATSGRSLSCFIKDFNGIGFLFSGNDASADGIQFDAITTTTGDGVQVTGSRVMLRNGASTNHGNDGVRIGATEAGASSINANCFRIDNWISIGNGRDGINVDHTNTSTSGTYPLGAPDCNAGLISNVFLGSTGVGNGRDGLRIANSIDNTLENIVAQENTGNGIRFTTSARGHKIFGYYCESNTAGGLLFDSGAHSNVALGGHAVIGSQTAVDSDGSNMILAPSSVAGFNGAFYNFLKVCNPAAAGSADFDAYCDTNFINAYRMKATQPSGSRGRWTLQTKANGGALADRIVVDEAGITIPTTTNGVLFNKTAVDTTTPGVNIEGGAVARTDHVNSGTGASTVHAFYNANGQVGSISTSASATTYATSSDYRLKQDVTAADQAKAVQAVLSWPLREFAFKAEPQQRQLGFIAHELQAVAPQAVTGEKDGKDMQGVDYSMLIPELVAAVQYLLQKDQA